MAVHSSYMVDGMEKLFSQEEELQVDTYDPVQPLNIVESVTIVSGGYGGVAKIEEED